MEDDDTRVVIARLARPDASGGYTIDEAAIRAEGTTFPTLKAWILTHGGTPQAPPTATDRGLHGYGRQALRPAPQYLLPPNAFK